MCFICVNIEDKTNLFPLICGMTKEEALHYFELDKDFQALDLLDLVDEKLFVLKNEVLQKLAVPSLLTKRLKESDKILTATTALQMNEEVEIPKFTEVVFPLSPIDFLEYYERELSTVKLIIFHAKYPQVLSAGIQQLISLQEGYLKNFEVVFGKYGATDTEVSAQQMMDSGPVLRALKGNQDEEVTPIIQTEAARVRKLVSLG